tara:strand:+ start:516 stop:1298 length:783 start_codon:yes stop_codon:yes gene_type:complete
MSEEQTLSYENNTETVTTEENLTPEEQDSLEVGEQMQQAEDGLLAGKYKDPKDLEKAYAELEKKLGEKSDRDSEEVKSEIETEPDEPNNVPNNILDELWEEGQNNNLTKETFDKLQKMSPVDVAKLAMQSRQQTASSSREFTNNDVQQIQGLVGGEENYNSLISWASENVSEQEVNMFDAVMDTGNPLAAYFAVQSMALKYSDMNGRDGQMVRGKAPKSTSDVFRSQQELIQAQSDPRYENDEAYQEAILQKLARSNINF